MSMRLIWGGESAFEVEVVVTWHCECPKCHWIVGFKMVNFILCEFQLNFLVKITCIHLFMSSLQKPYKLGTNAVIPVRNLSLERVRDLVKVTQMSDLKPVGWWLQSLGSESGRGPWANRGLAGVGGGRVARGEKHCAEAGSKQKGSGVSLGSRLTPAKLSVLNRLVPANSALWPDCAPQLLSVFLWAPCVREQPRAMTKGWDGGMGRGRMRNQEDYTDTGPKALVPISLLFLKMSLSPWLSDRAPEWLEYQHVLKEEHILGSSVSEDLNRVLFSLWGEQEWLVGGEKEWLVGGERRKDGSKCGRMTQ